jgi:hypothetical protein
MNHAFLTTLLAGSLIGIAATPSHAQTADPTVISADDGQGVNVLGAIGDSLKLLMVEHVTRIAFQEKTRRELSGPFLARLSPLGSFARAVGRHRRLVGQLHRPSHSRCGGGIHLARSPLSEASIGNVGMRPETTGWVDHVVTPLGAFGLIMAEDALDRFLVEWVEGRTTNRFLRASMRLVFNPGRALSNGSSGRWPWHRDGRPLSSR